MGFSLFGSSGDQRSTNQNTTKTAVETTSGAQNIGANARAVNVTRGGSAQITEIDEGAVNSAFTFGNTALEKTFSLINGLSTTLGESIKSTQATTSQSVKAVSETVRSANQTTNEKLVTNALIAVGVIAGLMVLPQTLPAIVKVFK